MSRILNISDRLQAIDEALLEMRGALGARRLRIAADCLALKMGMAHQLGMKEVRHKLYGIPSELRHILRAALEDMGCDTHFLGARSHYVVIAVSWDNLEKVGTY